MIPNTTSLVGQSLTLSSAISAKDGGQTRVMNPVTALMVSRDPLPMVDMAASAMEATARPNPVAANPSVIREKLGIMLYSLEQPGIQEKKLGCRGHPIPSEH